MSIKRWYWYAICVTALVAIVASTSSAQEVKHANGTADIYFGLWPVPDISRGAPDSFRWSGRRQDYHEIAASDVLESPQKYYDRRVSFIGDYEWDTSGREKLNAPGRLFEPRSFTPLIRQSIGVSQVPTTRGSIGDPAAAFHTMLKCYGLIDATPLLRGIYLTDTGAAMPIATLDTVVPARRTVGQAANSSEMSALTTLLTGNPTNDADTLLYMLQQAPRTDLVQRAVSAYERRLSTRRITSLWDLVLEKRDFAMLGWLHESYTDDFTKAAAAYRRAHEDYFSVPWYQGFTWYHHGLCLEHLGEKEKAIEVYRNFVTTYPRDFWVTDAVNRLTILGVKRESLHLDLTVEERKLSELAIRQLDNNDFKGALQSLKAVVRSNSHDPWSRLYGAYAAFLLHDDTTAVTLLYEFVKTAPTWSSLAKLLIEVQPITSNDTVHDYPIIQRTKEVLDTIGSKEATVLPEQELFAVLRDRGDAFPDDPLVFVLRARLWLLFTDVEAAAPEFPINGPAALKIARKLAPHSLIVSLHELNFGYHLMWPVDLRNMTTFEPVAGYRFGKAAEDVLQADEAEYWGLHRELAEWYSRPSSRNDAKAAFHLRAYDKNRRKRSGIGEQTRSGISHELR